MLTRVKIYKKKVGKTMSIWLIAAIGGLLATQFVNPVLIYRFFEEIVLYIKNYFYQDYPVYLLNSI